MRVANAVAQRTDNEALERCGLKEIFESDAICFFKNRIRNDDVVSHLFEKYPDGSEWDVQYEDGEIVARSERKIELVPDK